MKYVCFYARKRKNVRWSDIIGFMTKHGGKSTKICQNVHRYTYFFYEIYVEGGISNHWELHGKK